MARRWLKKAPILKHFIVNHENNTVICKVCNHKLKKDRIYNLKTHLWKQHKIIVVNPIEPTKTITPTTTTKTLTTTTKPPPTTTKQLTTTTKLLTTTPPPPPLTTTKHISGASGKNKAEKNVVVVPQQPKLVLVLKNKKRKLRPPKVEIDKNQFIRSYIGLITEDGIPLRVLDSENMQTIIDPICLTIGEKYSKNIYLNSTSCKKTLALVASNIRSDFQQEFKQRLVSLKIDSITSITRNLFVLSVQYMNNCTIQSKFIGMLELKKGFGIDSLHNFTNEITKVLNKYGLNSNQIVSITTDSDASMVVTSSTNIISQHRGGGGIFPITTTSDGEKTTEFNDIYLQNIELFYDANEMQWGDTDIRRNVAHSAQLCALDVTKDIFIKNYIMSCRNLTKFIRHNLNNFRESFIKKKLSLPELDCPTKWGSTFEMIKNIHNAKTILANIENIKNESQDEDFEINDDFWAFVQSYQNVMEPLQKTMLKFQEETLHYGNFYAQWLKCKLLTERIIQSTSEKDTWSNIIGSNLLSSIDNRTGELLKNEALNACLFLDPRFSHILDMAKRTEAVNYLKKLYDKMKAMSCLQNTNTNPVTEMAVVEENLEEGDEFVNAFLCQSLVSENNIHIDVYRKIEILKLPFQRINTNVMEFWKEREFTDPELYALSNICFAIPSTQVTIYKEFASLKQTLADDQNQLNIDTLEDIILVKLNSTFLDKAIQELPLFVV